MDIQEALKKLLSEKRTLLNNGKELSEKLKEYVSPAHAMELGLYRNVLTQTNIGERLMAVDKSDKEMHENAKSDAITLLKNKIYLPEDIALNVVNTLTEALGWNNKTSYDFFNDGVANLKDKKYDLALENFNQAIEMDSNYIEAYIQRGMVHKKLKNYNEAVSDYSKAIKLDSENDVAYRERGICYSKLENYKSALEDIEKVIQLGFNDNDILDKQKFLNKKLAENVSKSSNEELKPVESDPQIGERFIPEPQEEPKILKTPLLMVGAFSKKGDTYEAVVTYNGDGELIPSIGVLNGNILSIPSISGNFKGILKSSEGKNYTAAAISFEHKIETDETFNGKNSVTSADKTFNGENSVTSADKTFNGENSGLKKFLWAVAGVAVIIAFSMLNDVMANKIELSVIQKQITENEEQIKKYQSFLKEYGYVNESFYSEKAILFMDKNSKARFSIHCNSADDIDIDDTDDLNVAMADWEDTVNKVVLVESEDKVGCSTIKFENDDSGDVLKVLVVVVE